VVAPNANTFDLTIPRRPGTNDFNGVAKIDDSSEPPDPQTMPNAAEWNTIEWLILAIGRVMPVVVISIAGGATPSVISFPCARASVVVGTFTVTRNGAGDVSITWPTNTFPASVSTPVASLNGSADGRITATNISNGVRVYTFNAAGTATDRDFTVQVY